MSVKEKSAIALVGMMGCGKTTFGKQVAKKLELNFVDTDDAIIDRMGVPIAHIFDKEGEARFREIEYEEILAALSLSNTVIATGGGCVTHNRTLNALLDRAFVIWLRSPAAEIYERVKMDTKRPLLQCDDPLAKLEELISARTPLYQQAHIHIDIDDQNPYQTIDKILEAIKKHQQASEV